MKNFFLLSILVLNGASALSVELDSNLYLREGLSSILTKSLRKSKELYSTLSQKYGTDFIMKLKWADWTVEGTHSVITSSKRVLSVSAGMILEMALLDSDVQDVLICHELGHLFGGYPFYDDLMAERFFLNASEGQADYYATEVCVKHFWKNENNEVFERLASEENKNLCRAVWGGDLQKRHLCNRSLLAIQGVSEFFEKFNGVKTSLFNPEKKEVGWTNNYSYPSSQCRIDTLVAGAVCEPERDSLESMQIPGVESQFQGRTGAAREESVDYACQKGAGRRPACWFKD